MVSLGTPLGLLEPDYSSQCPTNTPRERERERERENLFAKKVNTIVILRITKYIGRLPEGVLTPSELAAYVNVNNQIESNNEKYKLKNKASNRAHKVNTDSAREITTRRLRPI